MRRIAYILSAYTDAPHLARLVAALDDGGADFYIHVDRKVDSRPFHRLLDGKATMTYLWYEVDGENVSVNIKYLADEDKYAFVVTETGALVSYIDFTVTGANDEPVTLTNGKFPAVGEYNVTGTYTINGYEGKLIFSVVVVEPEA